MENNISKCRKCGLSIIQEETVYHRCMKPRSNRFFFDTDDDFVNVFDGFRWIPIKSKTDQPTGNKDNNYRQGNRTGDSDYEKD